jgi:DNA-binding NarL/FixJ family response regulator
MHMSAEAARAARLRAMSSQNDSETLRPIERRVLHMQGEGVPVGEIAARFNKSIEFVERLVTWIDIPRNGTDGGRDLNPIERRVLDMRAEGQTRAEIADKFKKTERYIRQVEGLAHFKEGQRLLSGD